MLNLQLILVLKVVSHSKYCGWLAPKISTVEAQAERLRFCLKSKHKYFYMEALGKKDIGNTCTNFVISALVSLCEHLRITEKGTFS